MSNCYCCLFREFWCKVTANERNGKRNCFLLHFRMPRKLFKVTANERNGKRNCFLLHFRMPRKLLKVTANGRKDKTFCIFYNAIVQLVLIPFILIVRMKHLSYSASSGMVIVALSQFLDINSLPFREYSAMFMWSFSFQLSTPISTSLPSAFNFTFMFLPYMQTSSLSPCLALLLLG